jgi:transcriptional regulator GlxA family with amidase domain
MKADLKSVRVCLVAIPEVMASTLMGLYDVLNSFDLLGTYSDALASRAQSFKAEIVAMSAGTLSSASGVPVEATRSVGEIDSADVIIIPSVLVERGEWQQGRYPTIVKWLTKMHGAGAQLCSTCSGVLLLAETGLLDGKDATIHWMYAQTFHRNFPNVRLRLDRPLVAAGKR